MAELAQIIAHPNLLGELREGRAQPIHQHEGEPVGRGGGDAVEGGGAASAGLVLDDDIGAQRLRHGKRLLVDVDGDDLGTQCGTHHDGGEAHAAAAVDGQPLAGLEVRPVHKAAEGGGEAAAHGGSFRKTQRLRQPHQVEVGTRHGEEFRKGAPAGKADHMLVVAHGGFARPAVRAIATGEDEGGGDPVAHPEGSDLGTHRQHDPRELVPRHMRQRHVRVHPAPAMMVRPADTAGLDLEDDAIRRAVRIRHLADFQRTPVGFKNGSFHDGTSSAQPLSASHCRTPWQSAIGVSALHP